MKPKSTAVAAALVIAVIATIVPPVTTAPEFLSQIIMGIAVFVALCITLSILLRIHWFRELEPARQRKIIWIVASNTGLVVFLLPLLR